MDHSFLRWIRGRRLDSHSLFSVIRTYLILFFNVFELFGIFGWGFLHVHTNVNIRANQDILQINTSFFIGWNFILLTLREPLKQLLDIMASSGACTIMDRSVFLGFCYGYVLFDLSLVFKVGFVTDDDYGHLISKLYSQLFHPFFHSLEWVQVGDVVYYHSAYKKKLNASLTIVEKKACKFISVILTLSPSIIYYGESSVPFLSSSIPNRKCVHFCYSCRLL
jgi:hypothetical protein